MLGAVLLFVAVIGTFKFLQIKKAMAASFAPPPEAVTTVVASSDMWATTSNAIGSVAAVNGVSVSADLPGIVQEIRFESGRSVQRGDVLVRLDSRQEQAQLAAAEAQRELARVALSRLQSLTASGVASPQSLDQASAEFKAADARVGEIKAVIDRKTIRAPFSGVLGLRLINLGQHLDTGTPVVSLQAIRPVYVNFSVPQQEMARLVPGSTIRAVSDALDAPESGRIAAVDSVIDEGTRNGRVQAVFDNASGRLRPGMYVEAQLSDGTSSRVVVLPASAISYAPYGDSVFIVEDVKGPDGKTFRGVRQQFVKVGGSRGDQVAILSGVKPGEEVVSSGVFKLRPGAAVVVNNAVQPDNVAKPSPANS